MKFQKNILLKNYTTLKIGGPAAYFFTAKNKADLVKAVAEAKKLNLPFFILGGGSNLLISSQGYPGLVILMKNQKAKVKKNNILVEAGLSLSRLVNLALKNNLSGLEWAAGIPGTVGGAICGNASAFGESMKDIIKKVEVFDAKKNKTRIFNNKDCRFGYHESAFKRKSNLIILSAELQLKKGRGREIKKEMQAHLDYRFVRHPKEPSAGSIFKNPRGFAAWELIDKCGLKGKRIGGAQISPVHSNFIVNLNSVSSRDVLRLVDLIKKEVNKKFKIKMKEEIILLQKTIDKHSGKANN